MQAANRLKAQETSPAQVNAAAALVSLVQDRVGRPIPAFAIPPAAALLQSGNVDTGQLQAAMAVLAAYTAAAAAASVQPPPPPAPPPPHRAPAAAATSSSSSSTHVLPARSSSSSSSSSKSQEPQSPVTALGMLRDMRLKRSARQQRIAAADISPLNLKSAELKLVRVCKHTRWRLMQLCKTPPMISEPGVCVLVCVCVCWCVCACVCLCVQRCEGPVAGGSGQCHCRITRTELFSFFANSLGSCPDPECKHPVGYHPDSAAVSMQQSSSHNASHSDPPSSSSSSSSTADVSLSLPKTSIV